MSSEKEIREVRMMLSERLRNAAKAAMYGTVKSVDENARTCDVQIGGIVYEGVLLYSVEKENLRGRVLIPKRESAVIVARIDASDRLYVALFSEIDKVIFTLGDQVTMTCDGERIEASAPKIVLNGGELGGLINIEPLTRKINDLIEAFNTHTHTIPSGAVAVTGSASAQNNPKPVEVPAPASKHDKVRRGDYEDTNVTHRYDDRHFTDFDGRRGAVRRSDPDRGDGAAQAGPAAGKPGRFQGGAHRRRRLCIVPA